MRHLIALLVLLIAAVVAAAPNDSKDVWTLTTADFRTERIIIQSIDENKLTLTVLPGGEQRALPLDQFLQVDRSARTSAASSFVAWTTAGDRFAGEPVKLSGDTLNWKGGTLGEVKLSIRRLDRMVRSRSFTDETPEPTRTEDTVVLSNGDTTHGVIMGIENGTVSLQPSAGGEPSSLSLDAIAAIYFATTAAPATAPSSSARFRLTLADGTSLRVQSLRLDRNAIRFSSSEGSSATVPLEAIVSIEHIAGPVIWLSSLTPSEMVQIPYLDLGWPTRMNATVDGGAIRAGGRTFARGIGVHSYSRISWPIEKGIVAFRTQYSIDGDQPYADVTVRIKLDGKVAYEKTAVKSGSISPLVTLDIGGAKTIALEVDYGANGDVQDRFNWIEPALLRYRPEPPKPATAPTTAPTSAPSTQPGGV